MLTTVLLLAGSLNNLELLPGEKAVSQQKTQVAKKLTDSPYQEKSSEINPPFWILYLFLIPVGYLVFKLLRKLTWDPVQDKGWQKYLVMIVLIALVILLLSLFLGFSGNRLSQHLQSSGFRLPDIVDESLLQNQLPLWIGYTAVLLLSSLGVYQVLKRLSNRLSDPDLDQLRDLVNREISETASLISSGKGARETIIRCYQNMCQLLNRSLSQERAESATAQEFAQQLEQIGFSAPQIHLLTQLFEKARYSEMIFSEHETHQAISCLNEIAQRYEEDNAS